MDKINETPEVTSTISTLEKLHDTVGSQKVMEDVDNAVIVKPVEAVEQKLADFVADAFKATNKDLAFNESLKSEILKRLPKIGAIVRTEDGEGTVDSIQTLKEIIRVKFKDGDDTFYKRYPASEVKIIKNIGREEIDPEEKEHAKELAELEKLEKLDEQTKSDNDI